MPTFVVLEQAPESAVREAAAELAAGGAQIVQGWRATAGPVVCVGRVRTAADAADAVLAAVAGAGLAVAADAPREVIDQLCDDLRRIGEVDHRVGPPSGPALAKEERALLELLMSGAALGEAARELHISRRTADRRLAAARTALGARTTAEALRLAARLGIATPPR